MGRGLAATFGLQPCAKIRFSWGGMIRSNVRPTIVRQSNTFCKNVYVRGITG
jgi:hypothetical protein